MFSNFKINVSWLPVIIYFPIAYNFRIFPNYPINLIQLTVIFLFFYTILSMLHYRRSIPVHYFTLTLLFSLQFSVSALVSSTINTPLFFTESIKVFILIMAFIVGSNCFKSDKKYKFNIIVFLLFLLISLFTQVEFSDLKQLSLSTRPNVPDMGSFNAYSFLISLGAIYSFGLAYENKSHTRKIFFLIIFSLFLVFNLFSLSRGAVFTTFIGLILYLNYKSIYYLALWIPIVISFLFINPFFLDRFTDLDTLILASGRFEIWYILLSDLFSNPLSIFLGNGPGSIDFYLSTSTNPIQSAHSTWLQILYVYGLPALMLILYLYFKLIRFVVISPNKFRSIDLSLLFAIFIALFFDSYLFSSQIGPYIMLLFSNIYARYYGNKAFICHSNSSYR